MATKGRDCERPVINVLHFCATLLLHIFVIVGGKDWQTDVQLENEHSVQPISAEIAPAVAAQRSLLLTLCAAKAVPNLHRRRHGQTKFMSPQFEEAARQKHCAQRLPLLSCPLTTWQ